VSLNKAQIVFRALIATRVKAATKMLAPRAIRRLDAVFWYVATMTFTRAGGNADPAPYAG
jgi:hypothetical protein